MIHPDTNVEKLEIELTATMKYMYDKRIRVIYIKDGVRMSRSGGTLPHAERCMCMRSNDLVRRVIEFA